MCGAAPSSSEQQQMQQHAKWLPSRLHHRAAGQPRNWSVPSSDLLHMRRRAQEQATEEARQRAATDAVVTRHLLSRLAHTCIRSPVLPPDLLRLHRRLEEQAAEEARQRAAADAAARKAAAKQSLSPEPPAGQGVAQIRLRFRDGSQLQRRFHAAQPLQVRLLNLVANLLPAASHVA